MHRPPSLCDACRHRKIIRSGRGSEFLFCLRSKDDPRFPKYPPLPLASCPGFEPGDRPAPEDDAAR